MNLKEPLAHFLAKVLCNKSRDKKTTARPAGLGTRQCVQPASRGGGEGEDGRSWSWGGSSSNFTANHQCGLGQVKVFRPVSSLKY